MDFNNILVMIESGDEYRPVRPSLAIDTSRSTDIETFQSITLRPILKMQNEAIIHVFRSHIKKSKTTFKELKSDKKKGLIHEILKTNKTLKQFYLKSTTALFTKEELDFYSNNKSEINKRIIALLIERLCSQLEKIES